MMAHSMYVLKYLQIVRNSKQLSVAWNTAAATNKWFVKNFTFSGGPIHGLSTLPQMLSFISNTHLWRSRDRCDMLKLGHRCYSTIVQSPYPNVNIPQNISLPQYMLNEFGKYGNVIALIDGVTGQEYSYATLQTMVMKVTNSLLKMGVKRGSVVTIFGFNCPEYVIMFLAVSAAGGIVSTVNPAYNSEELINSLNLVQASVLVLSPGLVNIAKNALSKCPTVQSIIALGTADGCRSFSSLLGSEISSVSDNLDVDIKNDILVIPFSSGTTGLPKGVMLTHSNVLSNIIQSRTPHVLNYATGQERIVAVLPIFHIYGQTVIFLSGLASGTTIITLPKFDPATYLPAVEKYKATFLHVVPPLLLFLAKHPEVGKYDFSSVTMMMTGAAPASADIIHDVIQRVNKNMIIRNGYGLTETSPITHINPANANKHHSCGLAIPNTEYQIVDIDSRKSLGPGKDRTGEMLVRGPQIMKGYYKNEKATSETIIDGWLHTGDIGYHDEDGYLVIVDRIKELIKVKGLQVAPAELEALLVTHPSVLDAGVIGRPDDRLGEAPVAFVVLRDHVKPTEDTAKEIQQFVADHVAPFKKLVGGIRFCKEIPKAASGKILRKVLKAELQRESK